MEVYIRTRRAGRVNLILTSSGAIGPEDESAAEDLATAHPDWHSLIVNGCASRLTVCAENGNTLARYRLHEER